ncbi:hypothetical protein MNBD_ALPHA12-1269 [hydrothermal vent metagenome]|uniref:Uncharacterized protein n=1 Tax=hydrothermal vent metagenome TaxID=652676 RepID=A0A3B0TZ21_9ZZZZ
MLICWRSGGALDCQRLALRLISFPILCMGTTHGGDAGEASVGCDGGANKRAGGAGEASVGCDGGANKRAGGAGEAGAARDGGANKVDLSQFRSAPDAHLSGFCERCFCRTVGNHLRNIFICYQSKCLP